MQVFHTAGAPPNEGRMNFPMMSWTWKSRNALAKMERKKKERGIGACAAFVSARAGCDGISRSSAEDGSAMVVSIGMGCSFIVWVAQSDGNAFRRLHVQRHSEFRERPTFANTTKVGHPRWATGSRYA